MKPRFIVSLLVAALFIAVPGTRGTADITTLPGYTVIELGTLGGETGEAFAVNDHGIAGRGVQVRPVTGAGGGYIFNLSTSELDSGTHALVFFLGGSPVEYSVQFQVK